MQGETSGNSGPESGRRTRPVVPDPSGTESGGSGRMEAHTTPLLPVSVLVPPILVLETSIRLGPKLSVVVVSK